jgi:hypothetical protein
MISREGEGIDPGPEPVPATRRIAADKPSYPAPQRPANPHAPPRSRQDPSQN